MGNDTKICRTARIALEGEGDKLAPGACGCLQPDDANVLAEGQDPTILDGTWKPPAVKMVQ